MCIRDSSRISVTTSRSFPTVQNRHLTRRYSDIFRASKNGNASPSAPFPGAALPDLWLVFDVTATLQRLTLPAFCPRGPPPPVAEFFILRQKKQTVRNLYYTCEHRYLQPLMHDYIKNVYQSDLKMDCQTSWTKTEEKITGRPEEKEAAAA